MRYIDLKGQLRRFFFVFPLDAALHDPILFSTAVVTTGLMQYRTVENQKTVRI